MSQIPNQKTCDETVRKCLSMLGEHFDCVQLCCSTTLPTGVTVSYSHGVGNFWSRYGLTKMWVIDQEKIGVTPKIEEDE